MQRSDEHRIRLSRTCTAPEFAADVLGTTPRWLRWMLDVRDSVVDRFGFATRPAGADAVDLRVGGRAGPFRFTVVDDAQVVGGNTDRHLSFTTTFAVDVDGYPADPRPVGRVRTDARGHTALGSAYLALIWPGHRLIVRPFLRAGAERTGLRLP